MIERGFAYPEAIPDDRERSSSNLGPDRPAAVFFQDVDEREALFDAILVHDVVHPHPTLPATVHLDYASAQLARCFDLSHRLWNAPGDTALLRRLARSVVSKGFLDGAGKTAFKHIRARYKQLRFVYVLSDDRHRYPPALDRVTRAMSHLQDAMVQRRRPLATAHALVLLLLLSKPLMGRIVRELAAFRPTTAPRFREYVRRDIASLRSVAEAGRMTGQRLHAARKVISRQAALYDCLRVLYPSAYHHQIAHYVSTINGLMGTMHDEMVDRRRADPRGYARDAVDVPERISTMLLTFVGAHGMADER
jgi:hypothetical protein